MRMRQFGRIGFVSALTLGGGGIGQVWGPTTREESVATVREAIDRGITLIDVAPAYGTGEAERVVGEAFDGRLPEGVRVSTKCRVDDAPAADIPGIVEDSLRASLERMRLRRVHLLLLHNQLIPNEAIGRYPGTPLSLFCEAVIPAFEGLLERGFIDAWGITGIGVPSAVIDTLEDEPAPYAVQCVTNLLDSAGGMKRFDGPARPRDLIAVAARRGIGVIGIRALQAGALANAFDRPMGPSQALDLADYERARPFRALAAALGESPASLAYRYALGIPGVSTVVLGVKDRAELREAIQAEERSPLDAGTGQKIDEAVERGRG